LEAVEKPQAPHLLDQGYNGLAPYSATVGISEVREFGQIDVPGFTGDLHTRPAAYGSPEAVRPRNLYEAQRGVRVR